MTLSVELAAIAIYSIGLVWGAAKMHAAITALTEAARELKQMYGAQAAELGDHRTRIIVLEDFRGRAEKALAAAPHLDWGPDA